MPPIILFLILQMGLTFGDIHWNCNRNKQNCGGAGATCDKSFGNCTCPADVHGYKCQSTSADNFGDAGCTQNCQNGGTCYLNNGAQKCLCTADFHGEFCEHNRVDVKCNGVNLTIHFTPIEPFAGQVYIGNDQTADECHLKKDTSTNTITGVFALDESVCDGHIETIAASNDTIYKKELNIHYSTGYTISTDLLFNVTCVHSSNSTHESFAEIGNAQQDHGGLDPVDEITTEYKPAELAIRDYPDYMVDLTKDVTLGQKVSLFNYLNDDSIYKYIFVKSCTVTDDADESIVILKDGCPTEKVFFEKANVTETPPGVVHGMWIFKLTDTTRMLKFVCVVKMCKEADKQECLLKDCAAVSKKRRKREVTKIGQVNEDLAKNERRVQARVILRDTPPTEDVDDDAQETNAQQCSEQAVTMTTVIILIILTCVLLLATSILVACLIRSFRKVKKEDKRGFVIDGFPDKRGFVNGGYPDKRGSFSEGSSGYQIPRVGFPTTFRNKE